MKCPMHAGRKRPEATVKVGARHYCAPCAEGMQEAIASTPELHAPVETVPAGSAE